MLLDREQETFALTLTLTDPALALVAAARAAEAAHAAFLSAGGEGPDTADIDIQAACEVVPTSLAGIHAKLAMLLDIEAPNLSAEAAISIRACLASPAFGAPTV